jgi:hypothetical protein
MMVVIERTVWSLHAAMAVHMSGAACGGVRTSASNCASAALRSSFFSLIKERMSTSNCA